MRKFLAVSVVLHGLILSLAQAGIVPGSKDLGAIWFLGDSITQSNADDDPEGSPRKSLYDLLTGEGYTFTYTGHHTKNVDGLPVTGATPTENLYHYHSGISGSVIGDRVDRRVGMTESLTSFWTSGRLSVVKPNVILIMLGTNDMGLKNDLPDAPGRLRALVEALYDLPDVANPTVFLATIPPNRIAGEGFADNNADVIAFNAKISGIVAAFRERGKDIHFVDQFAALDADYTANMRHQNIHPSATGNETMAQQWFKAIEWVVGGQGAPSVR